MGEKMHSCHIFLFPFKFEKVNLGEKETIYSKIVDYGWKKVKSSDDPISNYNEQKYFYQFVWPCLFSDEKETKRLDIKEKPPLLSQYAYENCKGWHYEIELKNRKPLPKVEPLFHDQILKPPDRYEFEEENRKYTLIIEKVTLDIYERQCVGVFAFHLKNINYEMADHILLINQFGRRIYPPFFDKYYNKFDLSLENPLEGTKHRELPLLIKIKNLDGISLAKEEFKINKENLLAEYIPEHINCFFRISGGNKKEIRNFISVDYSGVLRIENVLDDRMFVICWYGAKQLGYNFRKNKTPLRDEEKNCRYVISDLCQRMNGGYEVSGFYRNSKQHKSLALNQTHNSYGYAFSDFWYQYVFVDGYGSSCANELIQYEQIEKHTYARWVGSNTLYGISRYSFVCISEPKENLEKPFPNAGFITDHIQTIYFKMVSLVLAQRAMVLNFSERIQKINFPVECEDPAEQKKALQTYKDYQDFVNCIFYREVTAQEQGIELYDMLQEHLRVEYHAKELDKEYDEMYRLMNMISTNQTNKRMRLLTFLTSLIAIPNIFIAVLGSRFFRELPAIKFGSSFEFKADSLILFAVIIISALNIIHGLRNWYIEKYKDKRLYNVIYGISTFVLYLIFFQFSIDIIFGKIGLGVFIVIFAFLLYIIDYQFANKMVSILYKWVKDKISKLKKGKWKS